MTTLKHTLRSAAAGIVAWWILGAASAGAYHQRAPEAPRIIRKSMSALQASATSRVEPEYPPLAKAARNRSSRR